jgi:hypothetical protein
MIAKPCPKDSSTRKSHRGIALALTTVLLAAGGCGVAAPHARPHVAPRLEPSRGSLTGELIMEGGTSADNAPRPIPGTVKFSAGGRQVATANVGTNGKFVVTLPAGKYQVIACTPRVQLVRPNAVNVDACSNPVQAVVRSGAATPVRLQSFIVP